MAPLVTPSTGEAVPSASAGESGRNEPKSGWKKWGRGVFDRSMKVSDWFSGYANAAGAKIGAESFWPKSGDFADQISKCARIVKEFTEKGVEVEVDEKGEAAGVSQEAEGKQKKKAHSKALRKIPANIIAQAHGICIYTSVRAGIAPFGGSGGSGLVMSRLPDGSWSAPSMLTPQNLSAGFMLGLDIFDVVLIINSKEALEGFKSHKLTIGGEIGVAAGPLGAGATAESSVTKDGKLVAPIFSYVKSRGLYAGVEIIGQAFLTRFDENERAYHHPGVTGRDILDGKVQMPTEVASLHKTLTEAAEGTAQQRE